MSFIYFIYLSISSNKLMNDQQVIRFGTSQFTDEVTFSNTFYPTII